jgi:hypothetical protein
MTNEVNLAFSSDLFVIVLRISSSLFEEELTNREPNKTCVFKECLAKYTDDEQMGPPAPSN